LDYFYQDASYKDFITKEGFLPATKTVGAAMSSKDPFVAEFMSELQNALTYPTDDVRYPEIKIEAEKAIQRILLGEKSVTDSLNDLQKKAEGN